MAAFPCRGSMISRVEQQGVSALKNAGFSPFDEQNESAVIGHLSGGGAPFLISCRSMRPKRFSIMHLHCKEKAF